MFRVKGTTSDVTTCGICGKPELRGTVVLAEVDADGSEGDALHAGTTCAARLTGIKSARIRREAAVADYQREAAIRIAREHIAAYGPVEHDRAAARELFFTRNPGMRAGIRAPGIEFSGAAAEVAGILASARAVLDSGATTV